MAPNPDRWQTFFQEFSPQEKTQFLQNIAYDISRMIQKDLNKIRKSLRKLRDGE